MVSFSKAGAIAGFVSLATLIASSSASAATAMVAGFGFEIPDNDPAGASSTLTVAPGNTYGDPVPVGGAIALTVEVLIAIDHTYLGDLIFTLTSPTGESVTLASRPGEPGQGEFGDSSNLSIEFPIGFGDRSAFAAENMGADCAGTDSVVRRDCIGAFHPDEDLNSLAGINMLGDWTLTISDNAAADVGAVQWWLIELDYETPVPLPAGLWLLASGILALGAARRRI